MTIKETDGYWAFYSARKKLTATFPYPVEDGRQIYAEMYGPVAEAGGHRDEAKSKYLVMAHGYNNSASDAKTRYNEIWRRLHWLGFRGQFVGLTWHGNVGVLDELTPWRIELGSILRFDPSTRNALQTSQSFALFLHNKVRNWAGGTQNVDVMAHSLGNLLVWDAMRLFQTTAQAGTPLFRNMIGVEAAIWPETFATPAFGWNDWLDYHNETPPLHHNVSYSLEDQKEHTWRFWFNRPYAAGPGPRSIDSVGGAVYHSYVPDDNALVGWMRGNDWLWRGLAGPVIPNKGVQHRWWHYHRNKLQRTPPEWRAPEGVKASDTGWGTGQGGSSVKNRLPDRIPTLMKQGQRKPVYTWRVLNEPVGATTHMFAQENRNATTLGWRSRHHSDFAVGEKGDADANMWFPVMWPWFDQFLKPAIVIGEE